MQIQQFVAESIANIVLNWFDLTAKTNEIAITLDVIKRTKFVGCFGPINRET